VVLTPPILEGLDGVQKMSKSLGNAIGIHEPPLEMYGKIMSISDEMMWRYYELLTDVSVADIDTMKRESHPMQAKKELARKIVSDFHSAESAAKAGDDWAKQFQKNEVPDDVEEVPIKLAEVLPATAAQPDPHVSRLVPLARLLVECGLADSMGDAARKIKQEAVKVDNSLPRGYHVVITELPRRLLLRVGRRVKLAVIDE